jgi:predicted nucleotidyltransferase
LRIINPLLIETFYSSIEPFFSSIEPFFSSIEPFFSSIELFFSSIEPFFSSIEIFYSSMILEIIMLEPIMPKTRTSLLTLFLLNPEKKYYPREIERILEQGLTPIRKELINLESFGLLKSKKEGNLKYYWADKDFIIYEELQKIILKTEGVIKELQVELSKLKNRVDYLFIYGSFASGKANSKSDIDLFIVGKIDNDKIISKIMESERILHREINYSLYEKKEFFEKIKNKDPFVMNVINQPKIMIVGKNDFESLGK